MEISLDCTISTAPQVHWTESNGEVILVNGENEEVIGLDRVGAEAFLLLIEKKNLVEVINELLLEYEVDPEIIEQDLTCLLSALYERKFIVINPSPYL